MKSCLQANYRCREKKKKKGPWEKWPLQMTENLATLGVSSGDSCSQNPSAKKKDSPSLSPCALFECFAWVFLIWRVKKSVRGCSGNKLDSIKLESVDLEPRIDKQPNRAESATKSANICALQLAWLEMLSDTAQHSAGVCSILGWGLSPHNKDYNFLGRWN